LREEIWIGEPGDDEAVVGYKGGVPPTVWGGFDGGGCVVEGGSVGVGGQDCYGGDLGIENAAAEAFMSGQQGAAAGGVDEHAGVQDRFSIRRCRSDTESARRRPDWRYLPGSLRVD
jgi:hypothetical protein